MSRRASLSESPNGQTCHNARMSRDQIYRLHRTSGPDQRITDWRPTANSSVVGSIRCYLLDDFPGFSRFIWSIPRPCAWRSHRHQIQSGYATVGLVFGRRGGRFTNSFPPSLWRCLMSSKIASGSLLNFAAYSSRSFLVSSTIGSRFISIPPSTPAVCRLQGARSHSLDTLPRCLTAWQRWQCAHSSK